MVTEVSQRILPWFDQFGRKHLPWQQNKTPYRVWVSEIMLQQTQVSRVEEKFPLFIKRFPDFMTLAAADFHELFSQWQGLGYNRRAKFLKMSAEKIVRDFSIIF